MAHSTRKSKIAEKQLHIADGYETEATIATAIRKAEAIERRSSLIRLVCTMPQENRPIMRLVIEKITGVNFENYTTLNGVIKLSSAIDGKDVYKLCKIAEVLQ